MKVHRKNAQGKAVCGEPRPAILVSRKLYEKFVPLSRCKKCEAKK